MKEGIQRLEAQDILMTGITETRETTKEINHTDLEVDLLLQR